MPYVRCYGSYSQSEESIAYMEKNIRMDEENKFDKKSVDEEEKRTPRWWLGKIRALVLTCVIIYISGFVITIIWICTTANDSPGHPSGVIIILMGLIAITVFLIGLVVILVGAIITAIKMRRK